MSRFAAIDIGSNALRLLIVESSRPGDAADSSSEAFKVLTSERAPVRLASSVFQTRDIDADTMQEALRALTNFRSQMSEAGVVAYRAFATASVRSAHNAQTFIERARNEADIDIREIDGLEEARLVNLAIDHALNLDESALLFDLGGGSLEISELVSEDRAPEFSVSLEVGTVRLLESFFDETGVVSPRIAALVREHLARIFEPYSAYLRRRQGMLTVGAGGNLVSIARHTRARTQTSSTADLVPAIDLSKAKLLLAEIGKLNIENRIRLYKFRPDRADVIVPALFVVEAFAELMNVQTITVPGVGLKEGIVLELIAKHFSRWDYQKQDAALLENVRSISRRYGVSKTHANKVDELACAIFDTVKNEAKLQNKDRILLRAAAYLHDVGTFIAGRSHHKHAEYIIENTNILGLSTKRKRMLALISRYHRRSLPSPRHQKFRALSDRDQTRVKQLAAILRIADGLDRSGHGRISNIRAEIVSDRREASETSKTLRIEVATKHHIALELWAADRKKDLFEVAFHMPVEISVLKH